MTTKDRLAEVIYDQTNDIQFAVDNYVVAVCYYGESSKFDFIPNRNGGSDYVGQVVKSAIEWAKLAGIDVTNNDEATEELIYNIWEDAYDLFYRMCLRNSYEWDYVAIADEFYDGNIDRMQTDLDIGHLIIKRKDK